MGLFGLLVQALLKTIVVFIAIVVIVELLGLGSQSFISRAFISEVGFAVLFFLVFIEETLFGMAKKQAPSGEGHAAKSNPGHGDSSHGNGAGHGNSHGGGARRPRRA
ncbi:MAG: hypothetical protein HY392_01470 [Candidatus Diapherotrites archaeon]|nr:hypothetical protein [Candidatus Diapherotrites archaeon]